ncbi:hypothetical protein DIPPA_28332 [Diplonema papillatum]|nr:hypothetical protein DIPPA_28332 [Diplonema papillatum]
MNDKHPPSKHVYGLGDKKSSLVVGVHPTAEDRARTRYLQLVKQLKDVGGEKGGSKKACALLEELVCNDRFLHPSNAATLMPFMPYDKVSIQELVAVALWRCLTQGEPLLVKDFNALTRAGISCVQSDAPEVRRTGFLVLLMLHLLQQSSQALALQLPSYSFSCSLISALNTSLDAKCSEKRGFSGKTSWHEVKKTRLQSHLAALTVFSKFFVTHVYSYLHQHPCDITGLLILTAQEYSHKAKDIPVVRECILCLCQIAEIDPESVEAAVKHLPADMKQIHSGPPARRDRDLKKKEVFTFPCWDSLAAANLAKLCLGVLHKLGRGAALKSPFMRSLHLFAHYPKELVFAEVIFGTVKRSGMFYVLLEPDEIYGSKEMLLDYAVSRVQNMLASTQQVLCNVGLRLTTVICEQYLHYVLKNKAVSKSQESSIYSVLANLQPSVDGCQERFSFNPLITSNSLKAKIWLAAVTLAQHEGFDATCKPVRVRKLLQDLIVTVNSSPLQADHTIEFLKVFVRAMKLLPPPPDGCRKMLIPAFTGIIEHLTQRCIHKMSIHGFYSVMQEFLVHVDVLQAGQAPSAHPTKKAALDIDSVPFQRMNGDTNTLKLVLDILDGAVSTEVAAAEELVSQHGAAVESQDRQASATARYGRFIVEVVRFTGDFGNVMVNGGDNPSSNMMQMLLRLQALLFTEPHHIVWEAGLALLKIASRSLPSVRVKAYTILTEVVELRCETAALLAPLIAIITSLMELLDSFLYAQSMLVDVDAVVDSDQVVFNFYESHEKLKGRLAVYVRFSEKCFKPLGPMSEGMLSQAEEYLKRSAAGISMMATKAPTVEPGEIDLLFS